MPTWPTFRSPDPDKNSLIQATLYVLYALLVQVTNIFNVFVEPFFIEGISSDARWCDDVMMPCPVLPSRNQNLGNLCWKVTVLNLDIHIDECKNILTISHQECSVIKKERLSFDFFKEVLTGLTNLLNNLQHYYTIIQGPGPNYKTSGS